MAVQSVLIGASVALPFLLELIGAWKGDPEADALTALQKLQKEYENRFLFQEQAKVNREAELAADYAPPAGKIMQQAALAQSGYLDQELLGGPSLAATVAGQIGVSKEDLRARLSPRRLGNLSDMVATTEPY